MADVGVGSADGTDVIIWLDNDVGVSGSSIRVSLGDELAVRVIHWKFENDAN